MVDDKGFEGELESELPAVPVEETDSEAMPSKEIRPGRGKLTSIFGLMLAVFGLIISLLGVISFIALIISIIGLAISRPEDLKIKKIAMSGILVSLIGMVYAFIHML